MASARPIAILEGGYESVNNPETILRSLTSAARSLAQACPSLRLITFCATDTDNVFAQFAPREYRVGKMRPLVKRIDELDGEPIRFWPHEEAMRPAGAYQGNCSKAWGYLGWVKLELDPGYEDEYGPW
jgi:hypothetical protein